MQRIPALILLSLFVAPIPDTGEARKLSALVTTRTVGDVRGFVADGDGPWIAYLADQDLAGIPELYAVPRDGSLAAERRSGPLVAGGAIRAYATTPDGLRLLYLADQDTNDVFELYSVPLAGGTPLRLNAPPVAGGDVLEASTFANALSFVATPDGQQVVYRADQDVNGVEQLYVVPADGSNTPLALFPPVAWPVTVSQARLTPNGLAVIFVADLLQDNVFELFGVLLDGSLSPVHLSSPLVAGGDVLSVELTADGARAVYLADQDVDGRNELYSLPLNLSSSPVKLNGALSGTDDVLQFAPDATSQLVVFRARLAGDTQAELHAAPVDGSTPSVRLSTPGAGFVVDFELTSDGSRALLNRSGVGFTSLPLDQSAAEILVSAVAYPNHELTPDGSRLVYAIPSAGGGLHVVPLDGSSPAIDLTAGAFPDSKIGALRISADSTRIAFLASPQSAPSLCSVPTDGSSAPLLLDTTGPWGSFGTSFPGVTLGSTYSLAGGRAFFLVERSNGVTELGTCALDGSDVPQTLNGPLLESTFSNDVVHYRISPDGKWVVYGDGAGGVYAVPLRRSAPPVRLSPPGLQSTFGGIREILVSDDSETVFFAFEEFAFQALYRVSIDGSTPALLLDVAFETGVQALPPGFTDLRLSPDGQTLVYHQALTAVATPFPTRVYARPANGTGSRVLLAAEDGGYLKLSPDGQYVLYDNAHYVYPSDQGVAIDQSLWSRPVDGSAPPASFYTTDVEFQALRNVQFTGTGDQVVFRFYQASPGASELRRAPVDASSSGVVIDTGVDQPFRVSPDGTHVAYVVSTGTARELRYRPLDLSAPAVVLASVSNPGRIVDLQLSDDGTKVVYVANPSQTFTYELFRVPLDQSQPPRPISFPFVSGGSLRTDLFGRPSEFRITPDGTEVLYICDGRVDGAFELFRSPMEGPPSGGPGTLLHEPLTAGKSIERDFRLLNDGRCVLHRGDSPSSNETVLTLASLEVPGDFRQVSGPTLNPSAQISSSEVDTGETFVVYPADQEAANVFELFAFRLRPRPVHPAGTPTRFVTR